ncbi:MAG: hypothetical protein AABY13_05445 [Nanoarchaeota archaeon]
MYPLALALGSGVVIVDLWNARTGFLPVPTRGHWALLVPMLPAAIQFSAISIASFMTLHGSLLVVSYSLGAVAVAQFSVVRTVSNVPQQVTRLIIAALWPEITLLGSRGTDNRLARLHYAVSGIAICLSAAVGGWLWFAGDFVVGIWTSGQVPVQPGLLHILIAYSVLAATWQTSCIFSLALNRHRTFAVSLLLSSTVGLLGAVALVSSLQLPGVVASLIAAEALFGYYPIQRSACEASGASTGTFIPWLWRGVCMVCVVSLGLNWLVFRVCDARSITGIVGAAAVTVPAVAWFGWIAWLPRDVRSEIVVKARWLSLARRRRM